MISYTTVHRGYPNDPALSAPGLLQQGQNTTGNETILIFGGRKPLTRVPMSYCLNGPAAQLLGYGIYTEHMADCEAICVVGLDQQGQPQQVGFSHVVSGDPNQVDWGHLMQGMANCASVYAVVATSWGPPALGALAQHLVDNNIIPTNQVLVYNYGPDSARAGKTFGINELQEVGEPDCRYLVERKDHVSLNNALRQYMILNPGLTSRDEHWAMKLPS